MKLWKVVLSLFFVALLLPVCNALAAADVKYPVQLTLDGKTLKPLVPARIVDNYTLVPIRVIAEEFGAEIKWDGDAQKVTIQNGTVQILLFVDKKDAYINGTKTAFSVAPINDDGTVLVPLRFVLEHFNVEFAYDETTKTVHMKTKRLPTPGAGTGIGDGSGVNPDENPGNPGSNIPCAANVNNVAGNLSQTCQGQPEETHITGIEMTESGLFVHSDGAQLTPTTFTLPDPYRIVYDFKDVKLADGLALLAKGGEGKLPSSHPLVAQVRFSQYSQDPDVVRVTLDMKERAFQYPMPNMPAGQFAADITKSHVSDSQAVIVDGVKKYKVVLDAGHGDHDPGASSPDGRKEKDFNLAMVKKVGAILEKEAHIMVLYTRQDDTFVELDDRVKFANEQNAALFLSIHANSYLNTSHGVETYYWREESLDLAEMIHAYALKAGGLTDRGVRQNNFRVIVKTTMPAVLLEAGYLSNAQEAKLLFDETYQNKLAAGIADAIKAYLGL